MAKEAVTKLEPAVAEQMAAQLGGFDMPTEGAMPLVWIALLPKEELPRVKFFVRKQESVW